MGIQQHLYFKDIDIFTLYKQDAYPFNFDNSSSDGDDDNPWARRQFSSIWSPQPQKYTINNKDSNTGSYAVNSMTNYIDKSIFRKCLIAEREEERDCFYLKLNKDNNVVNDSTTNTTPTSSGLPLPTSTISNNDSATKTVEVVGITTTAMEIIGEE